MSNLLVTAIPLVVAVGAGLGAGWVMWRSNHLVIPLDRWSQMLELFDEHEELLERSNHFESARIEVLESTAEGLIGQISTTAANAPPLPNELRSHPVESDTTAEGSFPTSRESRLHELQELVWDRDRQLRQAQIDVIRGEETLEEMRRSLDVMTERVGSTNGVIAALQAELAEATHAATDVPELRVTVKNLSDQLEHEQRKRAQAEAELNDTFELVLELRERA